MIKLESALELASLGFWVFPILPWPEGEKSLGKEPAVKFKDAATRDALQIEQWWSQRDFNIGIYTGKFRDDEALCVVDVDIKGSKKGDETILALELAGCELPDTREHITATGGRHLFFALPKPLRQGVNVLGPGVDIRSRGGYVVAPGSTIKSVPYRVGNTAPVAPAPAWLIAKCGETRDRAELATVPVEGVDHKRARERARHYLLNDAPVAVKGDGGDAMTYAVAAKTKDFGVSQQECLDLMFDHWNPRCPPGWSYDRLGEKVRNAYRYGIDPPGISDPAADFSVVKTAEQSAQDPKPVRKFNVRMFADIEPDLNKQWTVDDLLPANGVAVLYAQPNQGKSFTALDMGMAVARGTPWHGRETAKGAVLYVATEGTQAGRIKAYRQHHGLEGRAFPFAVIEDGANLCGASSDTAAIAQAGNDLAAATGEALALIVIDTLAMALSGGDENSGQDMGAMLSNVRSIQRATGATMLIVHHEGKEASRGMRGSSALGGTVDTTLKIKDGVIEIIKQRDGETGAQFAFKLERIEIGTNARGKVVSSCVVIPANASARRDFAIPKTGTASAAALAVLKSLVESEGIAPPNLAASAGVFDPPSKVVSLDRWRETLATGEFAKSKGGTLKAPGTLKKAIERARAELVPGHVTESAGYVWPRQLAA